MKRETLEKLTVTQLRKLLAEKTILLLESIESKADGITIRDQKKDVEFLQELLDEKKKGEQDNYSNQELRKFCSFLLSNYIAFAPDLYLQITDPFFASF